MWAARQLPNTLKMEIKLIFIAQVLLYLLLMEERYGTPLDWGLLWWVARITC